MRTLGDQELEVFRFVTEKEPISVANVAHGFGEPRGLAKTTILTIMERLRQKGFLTRRKEEGVFLYRSAQPSHQVMHEVVGQFVRNTLGGNVSPFIAFLSESEEALAPEEIASLRALLDEMEKKHGG